jgi:MFS family permease
MNEWYRLVGRHKRLLNFGFLFNFFSSFGQTYFIALFVPFWIVAFDLTNATFGTMYATVTILSAFMLTYLGRFIDTISLTRYSLYVFAGLVLSMFLLSQAKSVAMLMVALFLVRMLGQGLMTHASSTGIAKHIVQGRGKALGLTALGHPAGQLIFPIILVPMIAFAGWRASLFSIALASLVVVVPTLMSIRPLKGEPMISAPQTKALHPGNRFLSSLTFWILNLNMFVVPFLVTAVFLYQYSIGQSFGWDASWVLFSFSFFAVFSAIAVIVSGPLVDRFSGLSLFSVYLLPCVIGLVVMGLSDHPFVFPLFFAMMGIGAGLGSTIRTAVQVEVYGTRNLGKIRGYFNSILVVSTALGPPALGFALDHDISIQALMLGSAVGTVVVMGLSVKTSKRESVKA